MIGDVVCGGDVDAGSLVSEEYLLTLERKVFCHLHRPAQDARAHPGYRQT